MPKADSKGNVNPRCAHVPTSLIGAGQTSAGVKRAVIAILAACALIPLLPVASAAPGISNPTDVAPVTLYFHLAGFQDFPINTQEPPAEYIVNRDAGATAATTSCIPGTPAGTGQSFHTLYGFSSPGFVEYDYIENGQPRHHAERALSNDVALEGETILLHWFVATQAGAPGAGGEDPSALPLAVPQVTVKGTLRMGEAVTLPGGGFNDGAILAEGQSDPAQLAGPATAQLSPGVNWTVVDDRNVYEILVPLTIRDMIIPQAGGFALRIDTFVSMPGVCDDPATSGSVAPHAIQVHSSPGHRPRLDVRTPAAARIDYVHPQFVGDLLYVHTSANSPFGNYDIDAANATFSITGPSTASSVRIAATTLRTHEHGRHTEPVDITFEWGFLRDSAADGEYTVKIGYSNRQHTAFATAEASFTVGDDRVVTRCGGLNATEVATAKGGCTTEHQDALGNVVTEAKGSPAASVAVVVVLLAVVVMTRRR